MAAPTQIKMADVNNTIISLNEAGIDCNGATPSVSEPSLRSRKPVDVLTNLELPLLNTGLVVNSSFPAREATYRAATPRSTETLSVKSPPVPPSVDKACAPPSVKVLDGGATTTRDTYPATSAIPPTTNGASVSNISPPDVRYDGTSANEAAQPSPTENQRNPDKALFNSSQLIFPSLSSVPSVPSKGLRSLRSRHLTPTARSASACCSTCCNPREAKQTAPSLSAEPPSQLTRSTSLPPSSKSTKIKPDKPASRGRGRPRKTQSTATSVAPPLTSSKSVPNPLSTMISSSTKNTCSPVSNISPPSSSAEENQRPQSQQKDIYELLLEIKGKQETSDIKFESVIDNKMQDLKSSLGVEISSIKRSTEVNANLVSDINASLSTAGEKISALSSKSNIIEDKLSWQKQSIHQIDDTVVTLQDQSDVLEGELLKLKCTTDQANLSLSDMVTNVEHDLVSHLETIKLNVEKEMSSSKQNQIHIENKLSDFTKDFDSQTSDLNYKFQELKSDFDYLKTINRSISCSSDPPSLSSLPSRAPGSCSTSSHPAPPQGIEPNSVYMFGDTTRTLILDGINETPGENLGEISIRCMNDIGIPLNWDDIESVCRIGRPVKNRKWPRPVKLTLRDPSIRDQIFFFKSRFSLSTLFKSVRVHKEERKDLRVRAAKLRQAGLTAQNLGHLVEFRPNLITIDGVEFNTLSLQEIPAKFMEKANEVRKSPPNKESLSTFQKCHTNSGCAIMVGLSLQKTPYGLAFYSIKCFLSNFYRCQVRFRGRTYICLEQAYQCTKALFNDESAFEKIYNSVSPADMKRWGGVIAVGNHWEIHKLQIMEDLLFCKFEQNKQLYYSLLNTRPHHLIESTTDTFWGSGCKLGSIALDEGCWEGKNHLGNLLVRVRDFFVRKLEIDQKAVF